MNLKTAGIIVGALTALFAFGHNRAMAYSRGSPIGLIKLTTVDGIKVSSTVAPRWLAMKAAAAKAGIKILLSSGFRTMEQQSLLYAKWLAGFGNQAAKPGWSNHQGGRAIDIVDARGNLISYSSREFIWLATNAHKFGFNNKEGASINEAWHFVLNDDIAVD